VKLFGLLESYEDLVVGSDAPVIAVVRKQGQKQGAVLRVAGERKHARKGAKALAECVAWAAENLECNADVPAPPDGEYVEFAHVNGAWWPVNDGMVLARKVEK